MELFFLMGGLALVVFAAVYFRQTNGRSARASQAVPMIEVHDRAIARSMLVDHADTFSDRPVSLFHVKSIRAERVNISYSISTAPHGPLWRALRCNLTAGILHSSRLGRLARLQREAVDGLIASLSSGCGRGGRDDDVVVVRDGLHTAVLTLLMRMCFGDGGFDARDVGAVQRVLKDFFDGMVYAPGLASSRTARLLHWRRWRRFLGFRSRMVKLLSPLISDRRRRPLLWCRDDGGGGGGVRPYADSLLDLQVPSYDDTGVRRALTDDERVSLVWEFLGAGTETVVSCVEWALAHLVNQPPDVQEMLRREVDGGGSEAVVDTPYPYLRAVILESLRLHPPVAVIQRDVVVGGGADPDGTAAAVIGVHVPPEDDGSSGVVRFTIVPGAIGRDSRAWTEPDEFRRPERFLTGGEGEYVGPMPGPKDIRMLPFGAGTRHCPGMGLGMVHVSLLLAALVRAFQWGVPPTGAPVDLTEVDGFVKHMKTPLKARIIPRT